MQSQRRLFGSAPYLGRDQELVLDVRFMGRSRLDVNVADMEGGERITIKADITGKEGRYNLITDCLTELCRQFEEVRGEPPMKLQVMTWEKVLNEAWGRVLLS